jgi:hypothetical protein
MPRTSRSVAQRLASQGKSRKRRPRPAGAPTITSSINQLIDDGTASDVESGSGSALAVPAPDAAPSEAPPPPSTRTGSGARRAGSSGRSAAARTATRTPVPRRRYFEYTAEYAYVSADLRRIALVAVLLIALLVVLSFVIQ